MTLSDQADRIGVGWDVAFGSLTVLTSIVVSGQPIFGPEVIPHYSPGIYKFQGNGLVKTLGYQTVQWMFGILTYAQYAYLSTTYCGGGFSGKVTVWTNLGTPTYVRVNAIMVLPDQKNLQALNWYKKSAVDLTRIQPAA